MTQHNLTPQDFDRLHEAAQKIFEALAKKARLRFPALEASFGRTVTQKFPLYTYVTFEDKARPEIDPVVVGIDVRVDTGIILLQADIAGEETGKGYFDLPKKELPFGSDQGAALKEVVSAAQQLADNTVPVLLRVFGSPAPVVANQAASLPEVAPKA